MVKDSTDTATAIDDEGCIDLRKISASEMFRCREQENDEVVENYAEVFKDYKTAKKLDENAEFPFPPVHIWKDENRVTIQSFV